MHLPTTRQIQIIADLLSGRDAPEIAPERLTAPWRDYYRWLLAWIAEDPSDVNHAEMRGQFINDVIAHSQENLANYALIQKTIDHPIAYPSAPDSLADVEDLQWLWKGWLLRGLPSLLAAAPGTGKSYLAMDLARCIIGGGQYPDGSAVDETGPVLYVDAENMPTIHKERLGPWPISELERLYFMSPDQDRFLINLDDFSDRDRLRDMIWTIRPLLVIVDSYGSCTLKGENNKEDVQVLLSFFTQVSREFNCGLLIVHHLRKSGNSGQLAFVPLTIDSVRGSSHIVAVARHIWGLQFIPTGPKLDDNGPRRLWVMKSNVGPPPTPLGVTFRPHPANAEIAQLHYGEAPKPFREPTRVEECADWILQEIADHGEPIRPAELVERGAQQDVSVEGHAHAMLQTPLQPTVDHLLDALGRPHGLVAHDQPPGRLAVGRQQVGRDPDLRNGRFPGRYVRARIW